MIRVGQGIPLKWNLKEKQLFYVFCYFCYRKVCQKFSMQVTTMKTACFAQVEVLFDEILKLLSDADPDDPICPTRSVQDVFAHSNYRQDGFAGCNGM